MPVDVIKPFSSCFRQDRENVSPSPPPAAARVEEEEEEETKKAKDEKKRSRRKRSEEDKQQQQQGGAHSESAKERRLELELAQLRQDSARRLAAKDDQIKGFRAELDALLSAAGSILEEAATAADDDYDDDDDDDDDDGWDENDRNFVVSYNYGKRIRGKRQ